jgi:eukaryotic-like serine/threonine-protein kinase
MGVVWQARDELLGRDVAVKELTWPGRFSAGERQAARRHAVREARAAARLSHRNVIQVFDILGSLAAVVADEPELAAHAGPLLWPVISGLLRKDPGERLDAVETERMLRLVVAGDSPPGTVTRRRRRSQATTAVLVGSAALAVVAVSAAAAVLDRPSQTRHQTTAAVGPSAQPTSLPRSGTGSRHPAAGVAPGSHLTSRTLPPPFVPVAGSVDSEVRAQPDDAVPPGHIGRPAKPGKGKGRARKGG